MLELVQVMPPVQPWENNYQRQADDAFARANTLTDAQLRALRPPLPQIIYLPNRFGYLPYPDRQWGVMQVFSMDRAQPGAIPDMRQEARTDYTQYQGAESGSDRNTNSGDPLGLGGNSW